MSGITLEGVLRLLRPVSTRVANLVSRGVLKSADDAKKIQQMQVELLAGETRSELERLQSFGFTSVPEDGAECVVIFVGGRRDHGFVIAADDRRYRPTGLQRGEVAVYDKTGSKIVCKANGDIEVTPSSGIVKVVGDIEATGDVKAGAVSLQNHTHSAGVAPNGLVAPAGTAGGPVTGNTGGPS